MGVLSEYAWYVEAAAVLVVALPFAVHFVIRTISPNRKPLHPHEAVFRDDPADLNAPAKQFPSIFDPATVHLSIILPAYKEQDRYASPSPPRPRSLAGPDLDLTAFGRRFRCFSRLPKTLRETLDHLEARQRADPKFTYEIIVVDDGSPDLTSESARPFVKEVSTEKLRILRLVRNRGKGGAVTAGVLRARGKYILFADADGATAVHEIGKLEEQVRKIERNGLGIGVGSRAHLVNTDVVVKVRSKARGEEARGSEQREGEGVRVRVSAQGDGLRLVAWVWVFALRFRKLTMSTSPYSPHPAHLPTLTPSTPHTSSPSSYTPTPRPCLGAQRSFIRNILMYCFHILVYVLGVKTIKDTQCGFKMCTRDAARLIFPAMHVEVLRVLGNTPALAMPQNGLLTKGGWWCGADNCRAGFSTLKCSSSPRCSTSRWSRSACSGRRLPAPR